MNLFRNVLALNIVNVMFNECSAVAVIQCLASDFSVWGSPHTTCELTVTLCA